MDSATRWDQSKVQLRRVPLRGPITKRNTPYLIARLLYLEAEDRRAPILVDLDSPGGPVPESLEIMRVLEKICCPVAVFCHGTVGGTALAIAAHGSRGLRTAAPGTRFVFSSVTDGHENGATNGSSPQRLIEILAKDTGRQLAEITACLTTGTELNAHQAAEHGIVDAVASQPVLSSSQQRACVA